MKMSDVWLTAVVICLASPPLGAVPEEDETKDATLAADGAKNASAESEMEDNDAPEVMPLIYSVNRTPEPVFTTGRAAKVITADEIWRRNARTLPEVLMEEEGIFVPQSNYGGGSPIIRGLQGKQILIMVNGIRVNNATYRTGPMPYLANIDLSMVDRIEIVRGVGSVLGSDTLGGSINIITKKGPAPGQQGNFHVGLSSRVSSADEAFAGRLEVSGRAEKVRYLAGATYRQTQDVSGAAPIGTQSPTGYDERGGNFELEYYPSSEKAISVGYQDLQQNDVPAIDRIISGQYLVEDAQVQRLQIARISYQDLADRGWSNFLQVTGYWNRQRENRRAINAGFFLIEFAPKETQNVLGVNLEVGSYLGQSHRLLYGVDYSRDSIRSLTDVPQGAELLSTITGGFYSTSLRGRHTDGAKYNSLALYLQDRFPIGNWMTVTLGTRYSRFSLSGREDTPIGPVELGSDNHAMTGAANFVFHVTPQLNIVGGVTRGFRAPNIDDVAIMDLRADYAVIPNTELVPEHIWSYEAGVKFSDDRFSGSFFYHYSQLEDLIVLPKELSGVFIDFNGDGIQQRENGEINLLYRQNIGEATIKGVEVEGSYRLRKGVKVFGNTTWTVGDDDLENVPLSRIPPTFGLLGFRWSSSKGLKPWTELVLQFASAQRRLHPQELLDPIVGLNGTEAFQTFHVRGGLNFSEQFRLSVGLENLFDETYKFHSSSIYRPGRQVVFGIEYRY